MRRLLPSVLLALVMTIGHVVSASASDANDSLEQALVAVYGYAEAEPVRADAALDALLEDPRFAGLPDKTRHDAYVVSAWLAIQTDDTDSALARYRQATAVDPDQVDDWYPLSALALHAQQPEEAAQALIHMAAHWPEALDRVPVSHPAELLRALEPTPATRMQLLEALTTAGWRRHLVAGSNLWYQLAVAQWLAGQPEQARHSARQVSAPENLIQLRSDKRFDALIDRDAASFDVARAAQQQVQMLQQLAGESPDSLELRNELTDAMLTAGMTAAALAHADVILARLQQLPADEVAYLDQDDRVWTMNNRAVALRRLGRWDESAIELEAASRIDEHGVTNVSQALNLAQFYCSLGRPAQAREALARAGDSLSAYGRMVKVSAEQRIALQEGDTAAAGRALAYLREQRADGQSVYYTALLEAGLIDDAASVLVALLADPERRGDALGWVQQTLEAPPLPATTTLIANRERVLARSDVQAAIADVGRIESYPVFTGYMSD